MNSKKGDIRWLIPWLIAAGVLVLALMIYVFLTDAGKEYIEYFKNLLRFGR